jgi:hypothetical protein
MKRCGTCGELLPMHQFNRRRRSTDGLQPTCRSCNRASARRYYALNRDAHVARITARARAARAAAWKWLGAYLVEHPCVDCGIADVRVLDFDHRPDAGKTADVMWLARSGYSLERIQREVSRCDVRCRNCHAIVSYRRIGGTWRDAYVAGEESS